MSDDLIFALIRRLKQRWAKKQDGLTQAEVDEVNAVLAAAKSPQQASLASGLQEEIKTSGLASRKAPLAAIVGPIAATLLLTTVPKEEGLEYKAYRDIAGIWTICSGDTKNVHAGLIETEAGCQKRTEIQLVAHAKGMLLCTPRLSEPGRDYQRAASTSLAYNIGVGGYCHSTADRRFDAGQWWSGCQAFISWNKARVKGELRPVGGLTIRRKREIQICGTSLVPGWTPENLMRRLETIA